MVNDVSDNLIILVDFAYRNVILSINEYYFILRCKITQNF